MSADREYRALLTRVRDYGYCLQTRNSVCNRLIAERVEFNDTPLVSLRRTAWKNALREWEWFMSGSDNINDLHPAVRSWWQPWADTTGRVANNYSAQFRHYSGITDQIAFLLDGVRNHPHSRRNVITTWNTTDMLSSVTPITNCHGTVIQAFVDRRNCLTLVTYQRSVDVVCGLPHNWIQYWAFLLWLAHHSGWGVGSLIWIGGDVHVYEAHEDLAQRIVWAEQPSRVPSLLYNGAHQDFKADDFSLDGTYRPVIEEKAEMIV